MVTGCDCDCDCEVDSTLTLFRVVVCSRCPAMTTQRCNERPDPLHPKQLRSSCSSDSTWIGAPRRQSSPVTHVAVSDCRASSVPSSGVRQTEGCELRFWHGKRLFVCTAAAKILEVEGQGNRILGRSNHGCATKMGTWPISAPAAKREPEAPFSNALGEQIKAISVAVNFRDNLSLDTSRANSHLCPAFSPFHPTSFEDCRR
jgi:hypothetical protein